MIPDDLKARFLTPLDVEANDDGEHWTLLKPLLFVSEELKQTLVAPKGMVTDFASTPPGTRNVFPKAGPWSRPAVMHDGAYQLQLLDVGSQPLILTKAQADRLFLEAMTAIGVPRWKRMPMYWAVHLFGRGDFTKVTT